MSKVKEYYLEEEYNPIEAIDKLQQENTKLRIQISAREEEYIKLQEENTKLKELCNKYEEEHNTTFIEWQKDIKVNKKAIEYINNNSLYEEIYDYNTDDEQELQYVSDETATNDLLNILQGSDKE